MLHSGHNRSAIRRDGMSQAAASDVGGAAPVGLLAVPARRADQPADALSRSPPRSYAPLQEAV
ncbi:hypothetical protein SAMN05428941_0666 [Streptomyces sp. 2114.2]|nr:hypothetical protein BX268_0665 [Streptomyces sp. 2221.1]SDS53660.1 hypothetical protein SAMN05428941_0666 [Streptomyces sp. 2114.2]